jgi:hypothetical protein
MTLVLDATVGGANSNSFITVERADEIAEYDVLERTTWTLASADDKIRSLVSATRQLDALPWVGERATTTQALAWPRTDAEINGRTIASDEIPREVEEGTYELALALLREAESGTATSPTGTDLIPGIPNGQLQRAKLDVLEIEWRKEGLPSNRASVLQYLSSRAPRLTTVLYGTLTTFGTGGSGLLVPLVRS